VVRDSKCQKIRGGPELDAEFDELIDPYSDIIPYHEYEQQQIKEREKRILSKLSKLSKNVDGNSSASTLSEVPVPSPQQLVVSDLPKSNSGIATTEDVIVKVIDANVSKGMISRKKSVDVLSSDAVQNYTDLRQHLTQGEVRQLDSDMNEVHSGVEVIVGQHLAIADEKKALQALFDQYDLCKYVRTADKVKLTIPELTAILTSFGQVDKRVRQATTRSTICYIILSVVLMDPKTFIEKLAGINKGVYSKK
jgi:hypothetical protein